MVSLAPNVRANSSAETTAFFEYSEKSVGAKICRNCIAPPPFSVVLNRSCCRLCEIIVADERDERLDGPDMVGQLFGKRQGFAHQTSNALSHGVVEAFYVIRVAAFLRHGFMLGWWNHALGGFVSIRMDRGLLTVHSPASASSCRITTAAGLTGSWTCQGSGQAANRSTIPCKSQVRLTPTARQISRREMRSRSRRSISVRCACEMMLSSALATHWRPPVVH